MMFQLRDRLEVTTVTQTYDDYGQPTPETSPETTLFPCLAYTPSRRSVLNVEQSEVVSQLGIIEIVIRKDAVVKTNDQVRVLDRRGREVFPSHEVQARESRRDSDLLVCQRVK